MTRPALTLLALAVVLPQTLLAEQPVDLTNARIQRCAPPLWDIAKNGRANVMVFPGGSDTWETDLESVQPDGPLCADAVWRLVDQPGARAKWGAASTAQAQAQVLDAAAKALDLVDTDVLALEAAAGKVYDAAKTANLIKDNTQSEVKIKRASFKSNVIVPNDAPTQFDSADRDKAAALLAQRGQALAQLAVQPAAPKGAKPGAALAPAQPGPLVLAYFQALDKVRADAAAVSALGVSVPRVTPLIAPSTRNLSDNYRDAMKALAFADKWDDQAAHTSALDALQDRALRNRVALNSANVEAIYQEARLNAGTASAGAAFIDKKKKEDLDKLNADLRAKVNAAIGYDSAKQAFDGDVAHNSDYADSEEGRYRANELAGAKAMADSAEVAANGRGGYQLQYKGADGQVHVVQGKDNIPDLKTAQSSLDDLTSSLASKILDDHKLLAKTQAALEAARGGATSFGEAGPGAPMGPVAVTAGCDKKGESLDEYKKRLRDQQMENSADNSAKRQGPLKAYKDALQAADEQYQNNIQYMKPEQAARIRDGAKAKAKDDYIKATQALGSMDDDIAARTARVSSVNEVAQASFVENIKRAAPQLATGMKSHLKKYVPDGAARALLVDGGSDDGKTTLFDQFIAEEWTFGQGNISQNADACKNEYREGDYGSLEQCAGKTLKAWLAKRKPGKADKARSVDDEVRETERGR
jgi:hypothetical protein